MVTRIVHVTESLAAGTLSALESLINSQVAAGCEVTLVHTFRYDTPADVADRFPPDVRRVPIEPVSGRLKTWLRLALVIRRYASDPSVTYLHLHSSRAGALGRLAAVTARGSTTKTFYSPHGFAFLSPEGSRAARAAARKVEWILARTSSTMLLVSASEERIAKQLLRARRTAVLENGVDLSALPPLDRAPPTTRPRFVTVGRIVDQKDPERFWRLAEAIGDGADFRWIGGPDPDSPRYRHLESASAVQVTGWMPRSDVLEELRHADVFVLASRYEGLPISLIEAQCLGIPSLVTPIVGNTDIVIDGRTGYFIHSDEDLIARARQLIADPKLWATMSEAAATAARTRFDDASLGPRSLSLYETMSA